MFILRTFNFPNELKLEMETNKVTNFLLEQSSSYRIWGRIALIIATYTCISNSVSCWLVYPTFISQMVLTIQGLILLCIHIRSGAMSHLSINWHGVSINLCTKEQEKEDEEARRKRMKYLMFSYHRAGPEETKKRREKRKRRR